VLAFILERPLIDRHTLDGPKVAAVFKAIRTEQHLTQEEAAREAGLTLSGYRPYEQGKRQLRTAQIPTFAKAFGVSVEALSARLGLGWGGDEDVSDDFRTELARRYGSENAAFVDEVVRVIKDFPDREAAFVRNMLIGAVHGARNPWRNSHNGARDIGDLVRA
jgi:transcriptional regulator with XRE-family HTH domain